MTFIFNFVHLFNCNFHIEHENHIQNKSLANDFIMVLSSPIMTLKNVKSSLNKITKTLGAVQDSREFLLKNTREIIILCSKSIIAVHKGDLKTGKNNLKQADLLLKKYKKKATGQLRRYLITPEQEFVEAACLIAIVEKKELPSDKKLGVMPESYVLGLLDCVGELKRRVFDKIRIGEIDEANKIFEVMEELYLQLYTFSMYDKVVKEARRKIDVNRILVDDVRSAITEEKRRSELIKTLKKLEK